MNTIDLTAIVLAVIGMVSGWVTYWLDRRKHRQEVESLKADNRQKDMELGKMYVDEFRSNIADPLRQEVLELREQIDQLRNAIQRIDRCPHRDTCPVYDELRKQSQSS
jgi:hypothetical protein